ncbi:hypothetical protein ACFO8Q_05010 [Effusibacillus consociatus]|uniref:CO dehydrogenase flavoprotein C-terminal domain-containing protein n=1 Tax=Effusibacillus consociatus TaxID=1117041 RepID=A0ABV9PYZ0_9BACL
MDKKLLTAIRLSKSSNSNQAIGIYRKVGRRETFVPALIAAAAFCTRNSNQEFEHVRLSIGGGENTPQRLPSSERLLQGQRPDSELWKDLHCALLDEIQTASDFYASSDYRRMMAANLLVAELMQRTG